MIDFETHKKFGNRLKEFREKLIVESTKEKAYKRTPEHKAMKALDELRNKLDDMVCRDFKEKDSNDLTNVYYGK